MYRTVPPELADDVGELDLCQLFHCTPSQLGAEDWHHVNRLMRLHRTIERWRGMEATSAANRGR